MLIVYRGPAATTSTGGVKAVRFDRDVPTWVRTAAEIGDRPGFEDWIPGRPAVRGRDIIVHVPNTGRWVLALPALVRCMRIMYPTCGLRIIGSDMFTGLASAWPGVSAAVSARIDPEAYRTFDLRKGPLGDYFLNPLHLKFHAIQYQVARMLLGDAGPAEAFVPELLKPQAGGPVVILSEGIGGWPELVEALRSDLTGMDVRVLSSAAGEDARIVRAARAVISIKLHPLLFVARLCQVPAFALVDGGTDVSEIQQLLLDGETFAFDNLKLNRTRDPHAVAGELAVALGLRHASDISPPATPEEPVSSRRSRRRGRTEPADAPEDNGRVEPESGEESEPDEPGDEDLPDPAAGRLDP